MHIKKILAIVLTAVAALFIIQNIAVVEIQFLFWSFSLPRSIFLVLLLGIGILIGWFWHSHLLHKKEEKDV